MAAVQALTLGSTLSRASRRAGLGVDPEDIAEVIDVLEILAGVVLGPAHQFRLDEVEDDVAEVDGLPDAPDLEDHDGQGPELLQGEILDAFQQLAAADVALLLELLDGVVERLVDETIGVDVIPPIAAN